MAGQVSGDWQVIELQADSEGVPSKFALVREGMENPEYVTNDRETAEKECMARNRGLRNQL